MAVEYHHGETKAITFTLAKVQKTWQACECFVMLSCIALGLLQLVAIRFDWHTWSNFTCFLRTRRRTLPSERTVKAVLAQELLKDFCSLKPGAMMQAIRNLVRHADDPSGQVKHHPERQSQAA